MLRRSCSTTKDRNLYAGSEPPVRYQFYAKKLNIPGRPWSSKDWRPFNFVTHDHCHRDHIVIVVVTADPDRQHLQCRRRRRPRHRRGRHRFVVVTVVAIRRSSS